MRSLICMASEKAAVLARIRNIHNDVLRARIIVAFAISVQPADGKS